MTERKIVNKKVSVGLALSALGLAGSVQSAKADEAVQDTNQKTEASVSSLASSSASSAASDNTFAQAASNAHNEFSSSTDMLDSSSAVGSQASSNSTSSQSSAASVELNASAKNQKADSNTANVNTSNTKTEIAEQQTKVSSNTDKTAASSDSETAENSKTDDTKADSAVNKSDNNSAITESTSKANAEKESTADSTSDTSAVSLSKDNDTGATLVTIVKNSSSSTTNTVSIKKLTATTLASLSSNSATFNPRMMFTSLAAVTSSNIHGTHAQRSSDDVPYFYDKYNDTDGNATLQGTFTPTSSTTGSYEGYYHATYRNYVNLVLKITFNYAYDESNNTMSVTNMTLGYSKDPMVQGVGFNDAMAILTGNAGLPTAYAAAFPYEQGDLDGATPESLTNAIYSSAGADQVLGLFVQNNKTDDSSWKTQIHDYTVTPDANGNFKLFQLAGRWYGNADYYGYDGSVWDYIQVNSGSVKADTIKETVKYVVSDGKVAAPSDNVQTVRIIKIGENGETDTKTFDAVDTPAIAGYTADISVVPSKNVNYDDSDIVVTVTYTPDAQKATVTYINDNTGSTITSKSLTGVSNAGTGYTTASTIASLQAQGYVLVSDSTNGAEIVFDNNTSVDQNYVVHLKHGTHNNTISDTVNRTIIYKMKDGSTAPTQVKDSLAFNGTQTIDNVTKAVINTVWDPNKNFADKASPAVEGYTPDRATVSNKNIPHDSADITEVVTYSPDTQKATVTYIDDTTGKTMEIKTLTGGSNAKSDYTTASSINAYKFVGYQLVSDSSNGAEIVFDHDSKVDQSYVVHMKHTGSSASNIEKKYVHRTITYVMADGSSAPIPATQTLTFTANGSLDNVTKQISNPVWSGDQSFAEVATPNVDGYTPDRTVVSPVTVGHDHADINEVVTYVPKNDNATVTYIDDATGQTLKTDALSGKAGTLTGYSTANTIDGYTRQGYKLVSDETGQNDIIMPANRMNFVVHLTHTTEEVNDGSLTKTVTRTIHYVVEDGKVPAPNDRIDTLTFTAKVVKDKVTGKIVSTTWSPKRNFPIVYSPAITGYTPDLPVAGALLIGPDHADIHEVITYKPNSPATIDFPPVAFTTITIKYIDDTTGQTIKTDSKSGQVKTDSGYTTKQAIDDLENKGYALVSDQTNGISLVFANDSKTYTVHVKHEQETATNNKTVNRTINYVMSDGSTPPAAVKDALTFTETVVKDKVTGAVVKDDWSPNQDFKDVASPAVKGYTVDRAVVSDKNIPYNHADIIETVVYTPENQKGTITYVDQTTGTVLEVGHIQGASNAKSGYTTANSLKIWEAYGYELIKDETGGKEIVFDSDPNVDQNYTVTLKHGTKTEDTSAVVKRTIDYVVKGGKVPAPSPVHDSLTFKGTVVIDKVTGKVANITWASPKDFKDVASPVIKGYKVDRTLVSDKQIAHDHPDIHEVVTYTPDTQKAKVIYVDDQTNQTLKTDDIAGDPGVDSGYNTKSNIQGYLDNGYELVKDDTNGKNVVFDDDPNVDQVYYVHFKHGLVTVDPSHPQTPNTPINKNPNGAKYPDGVSKNDLTKTVTRTINYVMADGSTPPAPVKNAKTFDKTLVIDKVTGQILSSGWTPSQEFDKVDSPIVDGYTPDKKSVSAIAVDHTSSDIAETVTYTPIIKKGLVVFVDTTIDKTIKTKNLEGKFGQKSGYSTSNDIKELEGQGYVLVQDDTNGQELLFDGQNYTVKLAHRIDHTLDFREAIRTVVFHLPTGAKTVKQIADVVRTVNKDAVTGSVTYGDWSTNKWKALDVLTAEGYTPSLDQIAEEMVSGDTKDKTIDVYYKAAAKDAKANIPASASSAASSASSAPSSVASSAVPSSVASSVASSAAPSAVSSVASSASLAPSSVASSIAAGPASAASVKTLPQTGADELAAVMESVLGLASAIAGGGLLKKKRRKTNKKNKN